MTGSPVVIDANVVIKLILPTPLLNQCWALMIYLSKFDLLAPTLWDYEITSAFSKAVHFKHMTVDEGRHAIKQTATLGVRLIPPDDKQNQQAYEWTHRLNRATAYDSYYLALAETLGCDLWTADRRLFNAVDLPWVRWVEDLPDNKDRVLHERRPQS